MRAGATNKAGRVRTGQPGRSLWAGDEWRCLTDFLKDPHIEGRAQRGVSEREASEEVKNGLGEVGR